MSIPGVQYPHWSPWFRRNDSWSGWSSSPSASPSIVVSSRPSACAASSVHDFTDSPSSSTVQAPQLDVSHPTFVPVSPRVSRRKYTRSVRGSTSASRIAPLTVTETCVTGASFCSPAAFLGTGKQPECRPGLRSGRIEERARRGGLSREARGARVRPLPCTPTRCPWVTSPALVARIQRHSPARPEDRRRPGVRRGRDRDDLGHRGRSVHEGVAGLQRRSAARGPRRGSSHARRTRPRAAASAIPWPPRHPRRSRGARQAVRSAPIAASAATICCGPRARSSRARSLTTHRAKSPIAEHEERAHDRRLRPPTDRTGGAAARVVRKAKESSIPVVSAGLAAGLRAWGATRTRRRPPWRRSRCRGSRSRRWSRCPQRS